MTELFVYSKQYQNKRDCASKKRNRRKIPSFYEMAATKDNSYYQKAVDDYEEFKRITKHKFQESREEASSLDFHGRTELQIKNSDVRPFNNVGKSVLTYKKLMSCIKSPYTNGSVIENLNKAYYPTKIKRGK